MRRMRGTAHTPEHACSETCTAALIQFALLTPATAPHSWISVASNLLSHPNIETRWHWDVL